MMLFIIFYIAGLVFCFIFGLVLGIKFARLEFKIGLEKNDNADRFDCQNNKEMARFD